MHVHIVPFGVGLAVVNALAETFEVRSDNGVCSWQKAYRAGLPVGSGTAPPSGSTGTRIIFEPPSGARPPDLAELRDHFVDQAHLHPGLRLSLNGEEFHGPQGLLGLALQAYTGDVQAAQTLWHRQEFDGFRLHVALVGEGAGTRTRSWVNGAETTSGGSHVEGLERALRAAGWTPELQFLSVVMDDPKFAGPTRAELAVPGMAGRVEKAMAAALRAQRK
ncbi:MAG: hypothetical protein AAGA87_12450 [Pseudomonadota bacterium]